jgi:hypothetical protein
MSSDDEGGRWNSLSRLLQGAFKKLSTKACVIKCKVVYRK